MRRREFIAGVGSAAAWPLVVQARQPQQSPRIGVLLPGTPTSFALRARAFLEGLRELGYAEGQTIEIEWKYGEDRIERFPALASELVKADVNVIVTGGTAAARALKSATTTIPIVVAIIGDPVALGLVSSLARPGGNVTGFSIIAPELGSKRLELLKEIVPEVFSIAVLLNPENPNSPLELNEMQAAAHALRLQLHPIQVASESALDEAFAGLTQGVMQALIVLTDPILFSQRKRVVELANKSRLPTIYFFRAFVEDGGLMSYAPSDVDLFRRSATYVDRILKGAKPSDLPVEQPTKFELIINLRTASALDLIIPTTLLARADEVIE
jgi:ABC-type uncharacterized transport system substrate-binding protein